MKQRKKSLMIQMLFASFLSIVFGLLLLTAMPEVAWAQAEPPLPTAICPVDDGAGELYTVLSGDFNGDSLDDIYLQRSNYVQSVRVPYSIHLNVGRTSTHPELVLEADGSGRYTLITSPNPVTLAAITWVAGRHIPHLGDFNGDGQRDYMLQASFTGETSAVLLNIDPGQTVSLNQAIVGSELGGEISVQSGFAVCSQDLNVDGREDLLVRGASDQVGYTGVNGVIPALLPYPPCVDGAGLRDSDCDGINDRDDAFAYNASAQVDTDGDGVADGAETDSDGDGVPDGADPFPLDRNNRIAVGATSGSVNVSSVGKASYRIPIRMIPSVADVAPSLSIAYDGQTGNNLMGLGFSIEGLSQITRCATTIAQDNFRNAVNYNSQDKFCLDGNRLIAENGAYGADGTLYRTERETYARITSSGQVGGGPQSFTVMRRTGEIEQYGFDSNSRRLHQTNGAISVWAISRTEDREGNYATFTYQSSQALGTFFISRIDYTGNAGAGLTPSNSVQFTYAARNDVLPSHRDSTLNQMTQRMTRVSAYQGAVEEWYYDLGYTAASITPGGDYDGVGGRSRLKSVTECAADIGCLDPTFFTWDVVPTLPMLTQGTTGIDSSSHSGAGTTNQKYLTGDVNGDGKSDLVWTYRNVNELGFALYTSNAAGDDMTFQSLGTETQYSVSTIPDSQQNFLMMDVNGDGKSDLVWAARHTNLIFRAVYLANASGTGFTPQGYEVDQDPGYDGGDFDQFSSADVNGDGRDDLVWVYHKPGEMGRVVYLSSGIGSGISLAKVSYEVDQTLTPEAYGNHQFAFGDVNGDSKADLVWTFQFNQEFVQIVYLASPEGGDFDIISTQIDSSISPNELLFSERRAQLADVNADGKADLVWTYNYNNDLGRILYLSTVAGTSFSKVYDELSTPAGLTPDNHVAPRVQLTDLNGDGNLDLAYSYYDNIANVFGYLWFLADLDGRGFDVTPVVVGSVSTPANADNFDYRYAEISGDGNADLIVTYAEFDQDLIRVLFTQPQAYPDHIVRVTDGLGFTTELDYTYLAGSSIYTMGTGSVYPRREDSGRGYVVSELRTSDGIGGFYTKQYRYAGARTDLHGRGYLGFMRRSILDLPRGTTTTTGYRQDFPFNGQMESSVRQHTATSQAIEKRFIHWQEGVLTHPSGDTSHFAYVRDSAEIRYDLTDGVRVAAAVETMVYDESSGNMTDTLRTMGVQFTGPIDGSFTRAGVFSGSDITNQELVVTTINSFVPDLSGNWRLGFLERQQMFYSAPGETTRIVTTEYDADSPTSFLLSQGRPFVGSSLPSRNTYSRDGFGNATLISTRGDDIDGGVIATQNESAGPFSQGLYPATRTNALNHVTSYEYDTRIGEISKTTDPNGLTTDTVYDGFGRVLLSRAFDGSETRILYDDCAAGCPSLAAFKTTTIIDHPSARGVFGAPIRIQYFDILGRAIEAEVQAFDGSVIYERQAYDALGRVALLEVPRYSGGTVASSSIQFDVLDRETLRTGSDGHTTTSVYTSDGTHAAKIVTTENILAPIALGGSRTTTTTRYYNALSQVAEVVDTRGTPIDMLYDTQGNLRRTVVNNNAATTIVIETDVAGNKTRVLDPDAGEVTFEYDSMARLRRKIQSVIGDTSIDTMAYDTIGRMTIRTENVGGITLAGFWTYDSNGHVGLLTRILRSGVQQVDFSYDHYSRLSMKSEVHTSLAVNPTQTFTYGYDNFSRQTAVTYPSGFGVATRYNSNGYLIAVDDLNTGANYRNILAYDARGNILNEMYGNGIETTRTFSPLKNFTETIESGTAATPDLIQGLSFGYDTLGNILQRSTIRAGIESRNEMFQYDELHRLKQATTISPAGQLDYDYDDLGNITRKSDVSDIGGYAYGAASNGAGPHAVSSVTLSGATKQYHYDTRGNMTTADDRTVSYTSFNKPIQISKSGLTLDFLYGPDQRRLYQNVDTGSRVTTTHYFRGSNGSSFEHVQEGSLIRLKSYVGDFMVHTKLASGAGPGSSGDDISYLHRDHNGSVEAVTADSGGMRERFVFAPFGSRRKSDWSVADAAFAAVLPDATFAVTTQGYTGHEHLDSVGIIHMNGRIYEPSLGRFMSPDTYVQFPEHTQSYNRYSYVMNNPLSYRDPSGEIIPIIIIVAWKVYDTYDTVTSGVEDFQTVTDTNASSADRAFAAVSLASNFVGVPKPLRKLGGAVFDQIAKRTPKGVQDAIKRQVDRTVNALDGKTGRPDTPSSRSASNGTPRQGSSNAPEGSGRPCSFLAGTEIATPGGFMDIEKLAKGDWVLARDEATGELGWRVVLNRWSRLHDSTVVLLLEGPDGATEEIVTTDDHPFWVDGEGWIEVEFLSVGDQLVSSEGGALTILGRQSVEGNEIAFDLEVDDLHTYFVGESRAWVHNCPDADPPLSARDTGKGDGFVDLTTPDRRKHILDGDRTGGGHRPGTGAPGKSEFPAGRSDDSIINDISDIATDPTLGSRASRGGRTVTEGTRNGVDIRVIQERNGDIVTGIPTNTPRNPE